MVEIIEGTEEEIGSVGTKPVAGGTILGIHNLAIVIPQFLVSRWNIPHHSVILTRVDCLDRLDLKRHLQDRR